MRLGLISTVAAVALLAWTTPPGRSAADVSAIAGGASGQDLGRAAALDALARRQFGDGDLAGAQSAFEQSLALRRAQVRAAPGDAGLQLGLLASVNRLADLRLMQGDLDGARRGLDEVRADALALAAADPGDAERLVDLYQRLEANGDVLAAEGRGDDATSDYQASASVLTRLAALAAPGEPVDDERARLEAKIARLHAAGAGPPSPSPTSPDEVAAKFAAATVEAAATPGDCEARGMTVGAEDGVCEPAKDGRGFSLPTGAPQAAAAPVKPAIRRASTQDADASARAALEASANHLPRLPWPPAAPSERLDLGRDQVLPTPAPSHPTLADVGERLVAALRTAGYSEYSLYATPSGFAIVARLERIEADGAPAAQTLRFQAPDVAQPLSLAGSVNRLFFAPKGYYRQIVLVVSADIVPTGAAPGAQTPEDLLRGGADRLPAGYRKIRFTRDDQVAALIYEYQKNADDGGLRSLSPGRNDALTNLVRSGIYPALTAANAAVATGG